MISTYITTLTSFALLLTLDLVEGRKDIDGAVCFGIQTVEDDPRTFKELLEYILKGLLANQFTIMRVTEAKKMKCHGIEVPIPIFKILVEKLQKYMAKSSKRRREQRRSYQDSTWVEVSPGSYKSEIVDYPADQFQKDLKKLLAIKAKKEKIMADLNK